MRLYALFWGGDEFFTIVQAGLWIPIAASDDEGDVYVQRLYTAIPFFAISAQLSIFCLDMLILLQYHRFGRKLSKEAADIVT